MATVIVGMTISVDGFVADRDGSNRRLYPDLAALRETPWMRAMVNRTGAVLMGRRTFAMRTPTGTPATTSSRSRSSS
jgi:riboflavin biosynthesis pyrimidine reductase